MQEAAQAGNSEGLVGPLSVERGLRFIEVAGVKRRLLELIYCECCGELFFAGMKGERKGTSYCELLPFDPDLDGLPDAASSQLFEDLSATTFGVFWPSTQSPQSNISQNAGNGSWLKASLDPTSGSLEPRLTVSIHGPFKGMSSDISLIVARIRIVMIAQAEMPAHACLTLARPVGSATREEKEGFAFPRYETFELASPRQRSCSRQRYLKF